MAATSEPIDNARDAAARSPMFGQMDFQGLLIVLSLRQVSPTESNQWRQHSHTSVHLHLSHCPLHCLLQSIAMISSQNAMPGTPSLPTDRIARHAHRF